MKSEYIIGLFMIVLVLVGCSANNPITMKDYTETNQLEETKYPEHEERVFVTR